MLHVLPDANISINLLKINVKIHIQLQFSKKKNSNQLQKLIFSKQEYYLAAMELYSTEKNNI